MRKTFRTRFWTQFRTPDRRTRKWPFLTHNNNYISSNDENCEQKINVLCQLFIQVTYLLRKSASTSKKMTKKAQIISSKTKYEDSKQNTDRNTIMLIHCPDRITFQCPDRKIESMPSISHQKNLRTRSSRIISDNSAQRW